MKNIKYQINQKLGFVIDYTGRRLIWNVVYQHIRIQARNKFLTKYYDRLIRKIPIG